MKFLFFTLFICLIFGLLFLSGCRISEPEKQRPGETDNFTNGEVFLPPPSLDGDLSVEQALYRRVSRRSYSAEPLSLAATGQLLWAAQGINVDGVTGASRTAPSAGATNPMEIFLVAGHVTGLAPGLYRYERTEHRLLPVAAGDIREDLATAALGQQFIAQAPASIVLAAEYERTTQRYGERGIRYVHMEAGHITQNLYLQAEALKLGAVAVGAFVDPELKALLKTALEPLMIIPVGHVE